MSEALAQLAIDFSLLSLITVGGVITVLPEATPSGCTAYYY